MPKFSRPTAYTGKKGNEQWTGDVRFANVNEAALGVSKELAISPATLKSAAGTLFPNATTTTFGDARLATLAQLEAGSAPAGAIVPTANDVFTFLSTFASAGGGPATDTSQGLVFLETDANAVLGIAINPNTALQPSNLAAVFAAPPAGGFGSTTPRPVAATTLSASGATALAASLTVGTTLGVTGASTIATLSATSGAFSTTLSVTGASTLAALSATTGSFSSTLSVSGASTIASLSATTGSFSSTLAVTGASTFSSGTFSTTLGVTGASTFSSGTFSTTLGVTGASTFSSGTFSTTLGVTGKSTLAALDQVGITNINISGGATTTIATGGIGALALGNATGNTALTGALTISNTLGVTGLTTLAALSQFGTTLINTGGAAATSLGTGGTGVVNIGNTTGNTTLTGALTISTTLGVTGKSTLTALDQVGTTNINISGAAVTSIGTGGTGVVNIGNTTGKTAVVGDLTVTTGNIKVATSGKGYQIKAGAATDMNGIATLVAGTIAVLNTNIATGDRIYLQRVAVNLSTTLGELSYTISNGVSFTINSSIIGTPASLQTGDLSDVTYFIVRPL